MPGKFGLCVIPMISTSSAMSFLRSGITSRVPAVQTVQEVQTVFAFDIFSRGKQFSTVGSGCANCVDLDVGLVYSPPRPPELIPLFALISNVDPHLSKQSRKNCGNFVRVENVRLSKKLQQRFA